MTSLYHVDTLFKTAENIITNYFIDKITNEIMNQTIHKISAYQEKSKVENAPS